MPPVFSSYRIFHKKASFPQISAKSARLFWAGAGWGGFCGGYFGAKKELGAFRPAPPQCAHWGTSPHWGEAFSAAAVAPPVCFWLTAPLQEGTLGRFGCVPALSAPLGEAFSAAAGGAPSLRVAQTAPLGRGAFNSVRILDIISRSGSRDQALGDGRSGGGAGMDRMGRGRAV